MNNGWQPTPLLAQINFDSNIHILSPLPLLNPTSDGSKSIPQIKDPMAYVPDFLEVGLSCYDPTSRKSGVML